MIFEHLLMMAHLLSVGHWSILVIQQRNVGLTLEHLVGKDDEKFAQCWTLEYFGDTAKICWFDIGAFSWKDDDIFTQCWTLEYCGDTTKVCLV